jgi:hypothetical protein
MQSIFNATRMSTSLRRRGGLAALAAAIALPVVFSQTSGPAGPVAVGGTTIGGTYVESVPIPPGATSANASVWDSDLFSNDLIWKQTIKDFGGNKNLTIRGPWFCVGEEVGGPGGRSGEQCAELFGCVTFYDAKGKEISTVYTPIHEVCCPDLTD